MNHWSYLSFRLATASSRHDAHLRFERHLRFEGCAIASDCRDGERRLILEEPHRRIVRLERAIDLHPVPSFGMADVPNRDVVVLAPEERYGRERLPLRPHIFSARPPP